MSMKETLESTASGWLSDLESRSIENVVSKWTEDIHYAVHPDTNGIYPMNREQFRTNDRAANIFKHLKSIKITINEMFTDVEKRTVTMVCTSKGETAAGSYGTDCLFVATMTEDGKKIKKLSEWIDFQKRQGALSSAIH
ncbi:Isomerase trt14 [Colletotrichum siamense]|uniref:Isomerase trt14 n=1 Tax=Colletotrichum siamense TaxID=690259 RepID=UPI0018733875|nr:Isomerase trt14 [Colletotrichum siamense]KAF5492666.1 Isomerase trt14 [Colletotrichum siamense]